MEILNVTNARKDLYQIVDNLEVSGPVIITSKDTQSVLMSKKEWEEMQETIYILSDPDMIPALKELRNTPVEELGPLIGEKIPIKMD